MQAKKGEISELKVKLASCSRAPSVSRSAFSRASHGRSDASDESSDAEPIPACGCRDRPRGIRVSPHKKRVEHPH